MLRAASRAGRVAGGWNLGADKELVARDAALAERSTHARLVSIGLRGVDVADTRAPVRMSQPARWSQVLPDSEPQSGMTVPFGENPASPVRREHRRPARALSWLTVRDRAARAAAAMSAWVFACPAMPQPPSGASVSSTHVRSDKPGSPACSGNDLSQSLTCRAAYRGREPQSG